MEVEIRAVMSEMNLLPVPVETLAADADLFGAGLTSFGSVQLMLAIEERFDIEFPERMLTRRTFSSIAAVRDAVAELVGAPAAAGVRV